MLDGKKPPETGLTEKIRDYRLTIEMLQADLMVIRGDLAVTQAERDRFERAASELEQREEKMRAALDIHGAEIRVLLQANSQLQIEIARLHARIENFRAWLGQFDQGLRPVPVADWHRANAAGMRAMIQKAMRGDSPP